MGPKPPDKKPDLYLTGLKLAWRMFKHLRNPKPDPIRQAGTHKQMK